MIKRFLTSCCTCGHLHTLRITLGTETNQEHIFACIGCGEDVRIGLKLDFEHREHFDELPWISSPTVSISILENCALSEREGTVVNLDPNFLIPTHLLHEDQVFPWMYEAGRIGQLNAPTQPAPIVNDVFAGLGGEWNLTTKLTHLRRAWDFEIRGQRERSQKELADFSRYLSSSIDNIDDCICWSALMVLGQTRIDELLNLRSEVEKAWRANPFEFQRFQAELLEPESTELLARLIGALKDYLSCYAQLGQTLIYARRGTAVSNELVASSKEIKQVKMFYGECFEQLATSFVVPACLNNISMGRAYDEFKTMTLTRYRSLAKASRVNPFAENDAFGILHEEFDSSIRNASHHGAIRLKDGAPNYIEYRPGDSGTWRSMPYAQYLVCCNRIMLCLFKAMFLIVLTKNAGR